MNKAVASGQWPVASPQPDLLRVAKAAYHALKSYEFGNSSPDLAAGVAVELDREIRLAEESLAPKSPDWFNNQMKAIGWEWTRVPNPFLIQGAVKLSRTDQSIVNLILHRTAGHSGGELPPHARITLTEFGEAAHCHSEAHVSRRLTRLSQSGLVTRYDPQLGAHLSPTDRGHKRVEYGLELAKFLDLPSLRPGGPTE